MASIHEYKALPDEAKREYMAKLTPAERDKLIDQMQRSVEQKNRLASARMESQQSSDGKWSQAGMVLRVICVFLMPIAGLIFFAVGMAKPETRPQAWVILAFSVFAFVVAWFIWASAVAAAIAGV